MRKTINKITDTAFVLMWSAITALLLTACASISNGSTQDVIIKSKPPGAVCTVTNSLGSSTVTTPDTVTVQRSGSKLEVYCAQRAMHGSVSITPDASPAMEHDVGLVGDLVDLATGAGNEYKSTITVEMK